MERLTVALEKFKQQRQPSPAPAVPVAEPASAAVPGPIVYSQTRCVEVPLAALRERRIVAGLPPGPFTDAYKILKTQVINRLRENNWNVLAISSPAGEEGKTLTAINLAVSLALDTTLTVLLVDADLRHPRMHEAFNLPAGKGLTDFLLDGVPIKDLLVHPGIDRLVLLPGGRCIANSADVLASPKMTALARELKHRYANRIVVFDLPPLLNAADVLAFAPCLDAMLLVVEAGRTSVKDVERALQFLKGATPVIGTVLNKSQDGADGSGRVAQHGGIADAPGSKEPKAARKGRGDRGSH